MRSYRFNSHSKYDLNQGFTLVELAVVLVVIGLVAGGVLIARDLIETASIRKAIRQIESYNAAVNVFRGKYGFLPGDMPPARQSSFGMAPATPASGAVGQSNGDGKVEACASGGTGLGCETALFWQHLSLSKLIPETFSSVTNGSSVVCACQLSPLQILPYIPTTPLTFSAAANPAAQGVGYSFITVYAGSNTFNYFEIFDVSAVALHWGGYYKRAGGISPLAAFSIDTKTDDGMPVTGRVVAGDAFSMNTVDSPGSLTGCVSTASGNPYQINPSVGGCNLRIQASW